MNVKRVDEHTIALSGLDAIFCELLHQIIPSAKPDDCPEAEKRLYSSPSGGKEPEFDAEWRTYVEPEMRELFKSNLNVVEQDLRGIPAKPQQAQYTLQIPIDHLDQWIHAINQARLALAARHDLSERDMEHLPPISDTRGLALFQVHFYGFLLECFIREIQGD